jgi:hypothetical protein
MKPIEMNFLQVAMVLLGGALLAVAVAKRFRSGKIQPYSRIHFLAVILLLGSVLLNFA